MIKILSNSKEEFISGNEAIVRGALEAGVGYIASYPGTPASEIGDLFSEISKLKEIYFEWSTNEKVALEGAAGASFSGIKALVSMKQYGLNVALDSLMPLVYLECPLVVVVADDPGCFSSVQTEEDSRWFSYLSHIPTLNPSTPQEAKEMTKFAFEIAFDYKTPVLIRMTTRVCYTKEKVKFDKIQILKKEGKYLKKEEGFNVGSEATVKRHKLVILKNEKIKKEISEKSSLNFEEGKGELGIVSLGTGYQYVKEALKNLNLKASIFKIGISYPFPEEKIKRFLSRVKKVLVIEENDPIVEIEVARIAQENKIDVEIFKKDLSFQIGELSTDKVERILKKLFDFDSNSSLTVNKNLKLPRRFPQWCLGCPHRQTFEIVKAALGKDKIFGGDIGCYMLGANPPYKMMDYVVSMGASLGIAHGLSKSIYRSRNYKKPVAFIGDSTFFHAGIPALINMVFNKSDVLVIILDNSITAMTGQQPHPGTGYNVHGEICPIRIVDLVKAIRADFVKEINVYDFEKSVSIVKKAYAKKGVSVVIAKGECILYRKKYKNK